MHGMAACGTEISCAMPGVTRAWTAESVRQAQARLCTALRYGRNDDAVRLAVPACEAAVAEVLAPPRASSMQPKGRQIMATMSESQRESVRAPRLAPISSRQSGDLTARLQCSFGCGNLQLPVLNRRIVGLQSMREADQTIRVSSPRVGGALVKVIRRNRLVIQRSADVRSPRRSAIDWNLVSHHAGATSILIRRIAHLPRAARYASPNWCRLIGIWSGR